MVGCLVAQRWRGDQASRDIRDVPGTLLEHRFDHALGDVKEFGQVHSDHSGIVLSRVIGEGLGDEHSCVVDQRVDTTELGQAGVDDLLGRGRVGNVFGDRQHARVREGLMARELATTARYAVSRLAPMRCEAPVITAIV
jgi:hypothetical protein